MSDFQLTTSLRHDQALKAIPAPGCPPDRATSSSPWYLPSFHRDRLLQAATRFGWPKAVHLLTGPDGLQRFEAYLATVAAPSPSHVRVLLGRDGGLSHETRPTGPVPMANLHPDVLPPPPPAANMTGEAGGNEPSSPRPSSPRVPTWAEPEWEVVVDDEATTPSPHTHHKTTNRETYDRSRQRAGLNWLDRREVLLVNRDGLVMEGSFTSVYLWRGGRWVTPPVGERVGSSGGQDGTTRRWAVERYLPSIYPIALSGTGG